MMQYSWRTFERLELKSDALYINPCCEFCDLVLEKIKPGIIDQMNISSDEVIIEQEDWGWFLEFRRENFFYFLGIGYQDKDEDDAHNFGVSIEVKEKRDGFFFARKIESEAETLRFAEVVGSVVKKQNIQVFEEK